MRSLAFASGLALGALFISSVQVQAGSANLVVCNASPLKTAVAFGYWGNTGKSYNEHLVRGWEILMPGDCASQSSVYSDIEYYAVSIEPLAKWVNDGKSYQFKGARRAEKMCVDGFPSFYVWATTDLKGCKYWGQFYKTTAPKVYLYHDLHDYSAMPYSEGVANAVEARRVLTGRMDFERALKSDNDREAPFALGIYTENAPNEGGVVVGKVAPGLPGEDLGLEVGDRIIKFNGFRIRNHSDLSWVLDNISIFHNEPVEITIVSARDGTVMSGVTGLAFYPFNHQDYDPSKESSAAAVAFVDGALWNLMSELGCAARHGGETAFVNIIRAFNGESIRADGLGRTIGRCIDKWQAELDKDALLYPDATNKAFWASMIVPGPAIGKLGKFAKLGKLPPFAARSQKVARAPLTKALK